MELAAGGARQQVAAPEPIAVSDAFTVTFGCNKRFSTSRDRFANGINPRGFPAIPGNDFVIMITRTRIIAEARAWVGTPYRHQASLQGVGCDCLGLVRGVWRALHGAEPEATPAYTRDWAEASGFESLAEAARRHLVELDDRQAFAPGDVLLFRYANRYPAKHAAIATAPDLMVHAHDGAAVAEVAIAPWWRRRLAYAFAFPGAN